MNQGNRRTRQKAKKESNALIKVLIVVFGAVAVALTGFLVWSLATSGSSTGTPKVTPEVSGAPKLKADRDTIDLGDIKLGNTTQATFALTNVGDQALQITQEPYIEVVEGC
jgi:flagellar basal body-associated protein FliL